MATSAANSLKRKRTATTSNVQQQPTASKRRRNIIRSSSDSESPVIKYALSAHTKKSEKKAERILQESTDQYLVKWAVDKQSVEESPLDWILKGNVDEELVAAWENTKAKDGSAQDIGAPAARKRGRPRKIPEPASAPVAKRKPGRPRKQPTPPSAPVTKRKPGRPRKHPTPPSVPAAPKERSRSTKQAQSVVRSSENESASPTVSRPSTTVDPSSRPSTATPLPQIGRPAVGVAVAPRSSFDPQEFQRYSQLASSSHQALFSSSVQDTELASSPVHVTPTRSFLASGIVPDSQSSNGSTSYIPTTQDASCSKKSVSYSATAQTASGSNQQQRSEGSASYDLTTQSASDSNQQHVSNSTASYLPTAQDASGSHQQWSSHTGGGTSETNEDLDISAGLEEGASPPSSLASIPESEPVDLTQNLSQHLILSQVEERGILDTFASTESPTHPIQQFGSERAVQEYITQQSPLSEIGTPSQSLLRVIEESVLETEPPSEPQLLVLDDSEVGDNIVDSSSPLRSASKYQTVLQSIGGDEVPSHIIKQRSPPQSPFQPPVQSWVTQEDNPALVEKTASISPPKEPLVISIENRSTLLEPVNILQPSSQSVHQEEDQQGSIVVHTSSARLISRSEVDSHDNNNQSEIAAKSQAFGETSENRSSPLAHRSTSGLLTTPSQTQHAAQIVTSEIYSSTQDNSADSVRPTTELTDLQRDPETPNSRHDSSQQSPSPSQPSGSAVNYSSPPHPPTHSLDTLDLKLPPRPQTPANNSPSSYSKMSDQRTTEADIKKVFDDMFRRNREARPFTPKRKEPLFPPSISPAAGTRSPSTIPDRPPLQQAPTSLRMTALAAPVPTDPDPGPELAPTSTPAPASFNVSVIPQVATSIPPAPASAASDFVATTSAPAPVSTRTPVFTPTIAAMDIDDDSEEDSESLLNDDLELMSEEYIVPLPMEGRQLSFYSHEFNREEGMLKKFMAEPQEFDEMAKLHGVLQKLKALETHIDLVIAEANPMSPATSPRDQMQWGQSNCVKFRFLGALLRSLQDTELHLIVVIEKEDEQVFSILETFCKGTFINYRSPMNGHAADPDGAEGALVVTLLASNSTHIVQPPSAIICLDGGMTAAQIRKKEWSKNSDRTTAHIVPIMHLVIPRVVGHVERYVSSALDTKKRLHTIFCSLAQLSPSFGQPMVVGSPEATKAAELVADYLRSRDQEEADSQIGWPLPSIGSIKDVIEYQSQLPQQSQESIRSPPAATVFSKRPLENEHLDSAKRMRMTPQPSNMNPEITHISDSMPGTVAQASKLKEQVNEKQRALEKVQADLKAHDKRCREHQVSWEKRQFELESLQKKYRGLLGEMETCKKSLEAAVKVKENVNERFNKQAAEMIDLRAQFAQLQTTNLASEDEKVAEITRLRKELAESKASEGRAVSKATAAEATLEYSKEQYRIARDSATGMKEANDTLTAELAVANKKASGEVASLKKMHLHRSYDTVCKQNTSLKTKQANLEKLVQFKDDEIAKLKSARETRMGTRGQSPKTPRPGSRATSPKDRVSNLRNG